MEEIRNLTVVARLQDFISANIKKINGELVELDNQQKKANESGSLLSATNIKAAASFLGVYKAIGLTKTIISESVSAWDSQVKSVISLGNALGFYSQALEDQAGALQLTTKYAGSEILATQAKLAYYGLTEEQIKTLTPALLDFAAAQDLTPEAAAKIAAGMGESTRSLTSYGLKVTGAAGTTERFNTTLQQLTMRYKGASDQITAGVGGIEQMARGMNAAAEEIGKQLQPVLDNLSKWFMESLPTIMSAAQTFGKVLTTTFMGVKFVAGVFAQGIVDAFNLVVESIRWTMATISSGMKMLPDILVPDGAIVGLDKMTGSLERFTGILSETSRGIAEEYTQNIEQIYTTWTKGAQIKLPTPLAKKRGGGVSEVDTERIKQIEETERILAEKRILFAKSEREIYLDDENDKLELLRSRYDTELTLLDQKYVVEQAKYKGNAEALLNAERSYTTDRNTILNTQFAEEIKLRTKIETDAAELARKTAEEKKKQDRETISQATSNFKEMAGLSKTFGKAYQLMAITETTISTYKGAQEAYANALKIPFAGTVLAPVFAAAAIGAGLARVNEIRKQKFAGGGFVQGNRYTGDTQNVLANSGEAVLNTMQQKRFMDYAEGRNTASRNNNQNVNITLNLPNGKIDSANISDVKMSLKEFANIYLQADRAGELDTIKGRWLK